MGRGFRSKRSKLGASDLRPPNIEDPADLIRGLRSRPRPAGFGFIGRSWRPRIDLAGTYDEAWQRTRAPLPPPDFDTHYHNAASHGLVMPHPGS